MLAAINAWAAGGGGDTPEANLFALRKLIDAAAFRADSSKIVVWFGDAPGHDPVCNAVSGEADVTEASVTADLVAAGIKVIAVSVTYRVSFTATNGKETCTGTVMVGVPHDESGPAAADTVGRGRELLRELI